MMKINEIIERNYAQLHSKCNPDKVISESKTQEDIFIDVIFAALRKYQDMEISEEEAMEYLHRRLNAELFFRYRREEKVIFTDNVPDISDECP